MLAEKRFFYNLTYHMAQPKPSFRRAEPRQRSMECSCGATAKLVQRCNYPHGRKSGALRTWAYRCVTCEKSTPCSKPAQAKRGR
ncbi:MAG: hypothetical protein AABX53_00125 [Nanoarchaeota archaeon]